MKKKFDYQSLKSQLHDQVAKSVRSTEDWSIYHLHSYAKQLKIFMPAFDNIVGEYTPVDTTGMNFSRVDLIRRIQEIVKTSAFEGTPVTKLIQKSSEFHVGPGGYVVTDKLGVTTDVAMSGGLPASVGYTTIAAHKNVTLALATSAPEYEKEEFKGKMIKVMDRPVKTDPKGLFYPPICVMSLNQDFSEYYKNSHNILEVRSKIMSIGERNKDLLNKSVFMLYAHDTAVDAMKRASKWKQQWDATDCIKTIENDKVAKAYLDAEIDPLHIVSASKVPKVIAKDLESAYKYLEQHRSVRGSDHSRISPITHGVYYGELDSLYRGVTSAADVMYIMNELAMSGVEYSEHSLFKSAWSVLQYNVLVYRRNINLPERQDHHGYGVYHLNAPKDDVLVVDCVSTTQPHFSAKDKRIEYTPRPHESDATIDRFFTLVGKRGAIKTYAYPGLWDKFPGRIFPSLHAHSGFVWILMKNDSPYSMEQHIARMMNANMLKTYYPFMFKRFPLTDIVPWPTVCVKRSTKRKVNFDFEIMFEEVEPKDDINYENIDIAVKTITSKDYAQQQKTAARAEYQAQKEALRQKLAEQAQEDEDEQGEEENNDEENYEDNDEGEEEGVLDGLEVETDTYDE